MSAFAIKWLLIAIGVAGALGYGAWWLHDYNDAQAAQAGRDTLCKAVQLKDCTDETLMQAFAAREERMDRLEEANASNAAALAQVNAAAVAATLAVTAQAEREAASAKRLQTVSANMAALKQRTDDLTRKWLEQPPPPDVLHQLDEVLQ